MDYENDKDLQLHVIIMIIKTYSSTCADGTWELPVYAPADKRLRYWSSDYKYRFDSLIDWNSFLS